MIYRNITLLFFLLRASLNAAVTTPVWQTSGYVQSDQKKIINGDACPCTIGSSLTFTTLMSFVGSFPAPPYLVYGVSRYEGSDFLGEEMYELYRVGLTNRDVTFFARVVGISRIWILEVRYLVISKSFPHLVNTFDNMPVNMSAGPLTNISSRSLTPKTYTNTINFTTQATGTAYNHFSTPLTNNKIIVFPTTLYLSGTEEPTPSSPANPLSLSITATPISTELYTLSVKAGVNAVISKLHFSVIFYDFQEIFATNDYKMVYERICFTVAGGTYVFPPQFQNSFLGAWVQFSAPTTKSVIQFWLDVGSFGATMYDASIPRDPTMTTLSRFCYNMLYLKSWFCPGGRSYDRVTDMCSQCPGIPGCMDCLNSTFCSVCATALNYFVTPTGTCQLCTVTGCATCSTATTCSVCDTSLNYVLTSPTSCLLCDAYSNMFADSGTQTCVACTLAYCLNCTSLTTCQQCDTGSLYYIAPDQTCLLCDPTQNYFLDPLTLDCNLCTLSECLSCLNLTSCSTCNSSADYTINPSTLLCQVCTLVGCVNCTDIYTCAECSLGGNYVLANGTCVMCTGGLFANATSDTCEVCTLSQCTLCSSLTICITCNTSNAFYLLPNLTCSYCDPTLNEYINLTTLSCQPCSLTECLNCSSLTTCTACNEAAQFFLSPTDSTCYPCNVTLVGCVDCQNFSSCITCEGVGYVLAAGLCVPICGDGLLRSYQGCDDGNLINGDGCSATCTVQIGYVCNSSQPSVCTHDDIAFVNELATITRTGCNSFQLTTKKPAPPLNLFPQSIISLTTGVQLTSITENSTHFIIDGQYNRDLTNTSLTIGYTPGMPLDVRYSPTLPALYYTENQCQTKEQVKNLLIAVEVISYAILIASILSCKIVGLELFGVLQIAYFTLSSHSYLNIYLEPLTKFRSLNGLNLKFFSQSTPLPQNLTIMEVNSSFINNFNIMFFVMVVQFIVGLVLYLVGKFQVREKLEAIGLRLLKQGFITLVLFNIFNIAFSAGVHWKYAKPTDEGYGGSSFVLYGTLIAMVATVFAMELTGKKEYGQFKNKFKRVWICQLYIPLTICYRMTLGFYISTNNDYQQSTLIILSFSLSFMLYTIVNLPFKNVYQNYRCSLIHFTMLYILLTTNYYRSMKSTTPMEVKGKIYGPAVIELILVMGCIVVSFFVLVYEVYFVVRECWDKRKVQGSGSEDKDKEREREKEERERTALNQTQQSIDAIA